MYENTIIKPHEQKWLQACDALAPIFSTCSKRQYFAVIIGSNKRLISQGYNGSPPGARHCTQGACPRAQENSPSGSIYDNCIATHAEANAIMWADPIARQGATIVINGSPCYSCAKLIANSGITRVIGKHDNTYEDQQRVVDYLRNNRIETILLKNKEPRKTHTPIFYPTEQTTSPIPRHFQIPNTKTPPDNLPEDNHPVL